MKDNYIPHPLDTSKIELSQELIHLSEAMAHNVHEVWSVGRIADGWTYGLTRDDKAKTHPSLVPYEELSEKEKDYDRRTSQETLKFILKNGFEIKK